MKYVLFLFMINYANAQCSIQATICTPGVAGPFNFISSTSSNPTTCLDWCLNSTSSTFCAGCPGGASSCPSTFSYIVLYITVSGDLNILIQGTTSGGTYDVALFNVPPGIAPCGAISNPSNELSCNYASATTPSGCNQFGDDFTCASSITAPYVYSGQVLLIVVENWKNTAASSYTLQLGTSSGSAETGPPNATITPVGPFCINSPSIQLNAVNFGGTWSGTGVSTSGVFSPTTAGVGVHTINYSIGSSPCNSSSSIIIVVNPLPNISILETNVTCRGACDGSLDANIAPAIYLWNPGGLLVKLYLIYVLEIILLQLHKMVVHQQAQH
ncbi:MAG: hypothetical protein IPQ02_00065 [Saprospiraceae bacterium]|nr:hypothetical protein [Candidatus Defluviibacterium haderslevense]